MGLPIHEAERVDNWRADEQLAELVKLTVGEELFIKVLNAMWFH